MTQEQMLEQIVKQVLASMNNQPAGQPEAVAVEGQVTSADYPIADKKPELIKTQTGVNFKDLSYDKVINGQLKAEDMRIRPETLELQAQVADSVGRTAFGSNLRRAAELIAVPDERLLEIYNALRPYKSTKDELEAIAIELEDKYNAPNSAKLVREAADIGYKRKRTKEFK